MPASYWFFGDLFGDLSLDPELGSEPGASATGAIGTVQMVAPSVQVTGRALALAALASLTVSAFAGAASGQAVAIGALPTVTHVAPTASASGGTGTAVGTGALPSVSVSPPSASAVGDLVSASGGAGGAVWYASVRRSASAVAERFAAVGVWPPTAFAFVAPPQAEQAPAFAVVPPAPLARRTPAAPPLSQGATPVEPDLAWRTSWRTSWRDGWVASRGERR